MFSTVTQLMRQTCRGSAIPLLKGFSGSNPSHLSRQIRMLHLHEYQCMSLLKTYGVPVPVGFAASTARAAEKTLLSMDNDLDFVVKAQIHAGGRGLGYIKEYPHLSGIQVCSSVLQVKEASTSILGNTLITRQTGPTGKVCNVVFVCERFYIRREKYVAILLDRSTGGPLLIGSAVGGMSIESITKEHPESLIQMPVDISTGLSNGQIREFCEKLGFEGEKLEQCSICIEGLYRMMIDKDCSMVEINPLVETHDGRILACDAKINFDDNAEFRQKELFDLRDFSQEDAREVAAQLHHLNYVGLSGNIGCMVNGAGLAMATMDMLKLAGGEPANFLDVGGGSGGDQVVEAFRILQNDPQVKVIFINIFGGIMRCDIIALGLINASQEIGLSKPLIVRLEGTNQLIARDLLDNSGLRMMFTTDFEEAAKKAVKMTEILQLAEQAKLDVSFAM
ncbi:putative succinate-Coenzyme A ligase, beta subunit [Cardiosporidium cionae]|uniref:Succinate--CoA ligase [ADP-forming] subunit beta, mitochondrial n=1 Tax=Cardiosporidium cionae TaxID=476202 RepID=A0ABQ7J8J9_9APIC|nr:putative succinate-Coenzyme A ligase, beta subunit [Cardiosporidium cionae]|eukprot:KAF8820329.1 putative succinate-Coenzyme A ligase, beta subunit [Cardiosporidium cionae]